MNIEIPKEVQRMFEGTTIPQKVITEWYTSPSEYFFGASPQQLMMVGEVEIVIKLLRGQI